MSIVNKNKKIFYTTFTGSCMADILLEVSRWLDTKREIIVGITVISRKNEFYFLDMIQSYDSEIGEYFVDIYHGEIPE